MVGKEILLAWKCGFRPTGRDVQVVVRLYPEPLEIPDRWRDGQGDEPAGSETVRQPLALALIS